MSDTCVILNKQLCVVIYTDAFLIAQSNKYNGTCSCKMKDTENNHIEHKGNYLSYNYVKYTFLVYSVILYYAFITKRLDYQEQISNARSRVPQHAYVCSDVTELPMNILSTCIEAINDAFTECHFHPLGKSSYLSCILDFFHPIRLRE